MDTERNTSLKTDELTEQEIRSKLNAMKLSPSHDHWHLDRVLAYARQLQSQYGGDLEVLTAAVLLHDLGRSDQSKHGQESADESVKLADRVLQQICFPEERAELVRMAIREHDKPGLRPSTIEGRILKDADFLGGFGAWGVLRIAMWAGETAKEPDNEFEDAVGQVLERLRDRMPRRLQGLEFHESKQIARKQILFAELFVSELSRPPRLCLDLGSDRLAGHYIVLEGCSGSGKDTQASRLRRRLKSRGYDVLVVTSQRISFAVVARFTLQTLRRALGQVLPRLRLRLIHSWIQCSLSQTDSS